jgi:stringent starvation protein B
MQSFEPEVPSTRPYLVRALHEWCVDNGFSPYIAVRVDASVKVPLEFVKNGEIVLNVGMDATSALRLGNEFIEFKARFGGVAREIMVPVTHVIAIYARENGQGMAFPAPAPGGPGSAQLRVAPDARQSAGVGHEARETSARSGLHAVTADDASEGGDDGVPPQPRGPTEGGARPQLTRIK